VNLEVFVHKAEALSEEYKIGERVSLAITAVYERHIRKLQAHPTAGTRGT